MTPLRIGLTGGIGSGKSTVATRLAELGAAIIDTDLIARRLSAPGGGAIDALRAAFGADAIDRTGALDRARMRTIVFADADAKHRLEAILHPLIGRETERQAASTRAPVLVFDVPLLIESGRWAAQVDRVWVVDCREATQIERVKSRPGWSEGAATAVLSQQASRAARRRQADAVIFNDAIPLEELSRQVTELWQESIALVR